MSDDQAQHLRRLAHQARDASGPGAAARGARTIAVTGGKGGVGKTNLSVGLALCAARAGLRVGLFDADFGLAKLHVLLGLTPRADLRDVITGEARLADTLLDGPEGVRVLPGASGIAELASLDAGQRRLLLAQIEEVAVGFDLLLLDTGAGIGEGVLTFVTAADAAVVVTTPEPTALADAYALIKVVAARRSDLPFHLLVNDANSPREADDAANRITEVAQRFLGVTVAYAGGVPTDPAVAAAVRARKPFLSHAPQAPASLATARIATDLLDLERSRPPTAAESSPAPAFVQRLASLFGLGRRA